ncbi:AAA family ATPase [Ruegeria sp. Ofav3-42]|uniref:AAA family ATPase n=1 Tax=Ruegeria sp. Ofav3-42 TaxID=2917759 RepID=UPI001EF6FEB5|nr:AAA family ATPase [Ruegeria sp. Ofav3-42]MCG7519748.1 ATP-binding protein [Ruegeria sp. Ofav3-42]
MRLQSISYSEHKNLPSEWVLEQMDLCDQNLIVGRNATGKSRTLSVIFALSNLLSGRSKSLADGVWDVVFADEVGELAYQLEVKDRKVQKERLIRQVGKDVTILIDRGQDGEGEIRLERKSNDPELVEFQAPTDQIAVSSRQDKIQHPYLIPLSDWGKKTFHLNLDKASRKTLTLLVHSSVQQDSGDPSYQAEVVELMRRGVEEFDGFGDAIAADLRTVGYPVTKIGTKKVEKFYPQDPVPGDLIGLYLREEDLECDVEQFNISSGMFAAIATIVHVNYRLRKNELSCLVADDVGDGLDFERSSKLVTLLIEKSKNEGFQLILASNDRFILNSVPLEHWNVLRRSGHVVKAFNVRNSKEKFEEFEFTGLSNFDLLATDFLSN